ncbi:MccB [Fictibacillus macauensis ZFHKF-1]|uniref:MccB n=1 Tax=Fictibacillus macauensis ZFHKF-1 TaxID=1196324 RepID=I8AMN6_9BACL|nr:ThiF family adenylyltransferase [Fictibacillus macauensis]EIT87262.1 MccB [Fictibacillus macauensis ZFHKF-1]
MPIIKFKPYVKVFLKDNIIIFNNPLYQKKRKTFELNEVGLLICNLISNQCSWSELKNKLEETGSLKEGLEIIDSLLDYGYIDIKETQSITSSMQTNIYQTYNRILPVWEMFKTNVSPLDIQNNLFNKKVGIIGCGTVGINLAVKLALFGLRNFVLIDHDVVEESNLTRCPFLVRNDIGKAKVEVLKQLIEERIDSKITIPNIDVYPLSYSEDELHLLPLDLDILLVAADDEKILTSIESFSKSNNVPLIYPGGYYGFDATIFPLYLEGKNKKPTEINQFLRKVKEDSGINLNLLRDDFVPSSIVQTADTISNILSFEIIRYLVEGWSTHLERGPLMYNLANNTLINVDIPVPSL